MRISNLVWAAFAVLVSVFAYSAPAQAQATRTWVSGVGDDANPCSRTAPCKTFAGAISKTAANGEISVLDPGGFGAVTITKSISIVADGSEGGILSAGTNGIIINAGATGVVSIRGINIEGATTGLNGIRVISAANVYLSKVVIRGFRSGTGRGVDIQSATATRVYLRDCEINNNLVGLSIIASAVTNRAFIERSTLEGNSTNEMQLNGATASAAVSGSFLTQTGVSVVGGAQFVSTLDNSISGAQNPTANAPLK